MRRQLCPDWIAGETDEITSGILKRAGTVPGSNLQGSAIVFDLPEWIAVLRTQDAVPPQPWPLVGTHSVKEIAIARGSARSGNKVPHKGVIYCLAATAQNTNARQDRCHQKRHKQIRHQLTLPQ